MFPDRIEHGESNGIARCLQFRLFVENETLEVEVSTDLEYMVKMRMSTEDFGRCFLIESSMASRMGQRAASSFDYLLRTRLWKLRSRHLEYMVKMRMSTEDFGRCFLIESSMASRMGQRAASSFDYLLRTRLWKLRSRPGIHGENENVDGRLWKMFPDRIEHGESNGIARCLQFRLFVENETLEVEVSTWNTW